MLAVPYVTPGAFKAHPTYLDLLNLRSGDTNAADQIAELANVLLMASSEVDNYLELGEPNGTLAAHTKTENTRLTPDRYGRLYFHPSHIPILSVASLSYGVSVTNLTTVANPNVWIEEGRQVVADLATGNIFWSGSLQFGPPMGTELFTAWTYVAGYVNTLLASNVTAGAMSITVTDPTGITGGTANTPATTLRIWDPGSEESVTVASTYVAGSTTVPLTAPLAYNHAMSGQAPQIGVSAVPAEVHLAVVLWATALLMRPASKATSQFRGASMRLSTAGADDALGDGAGLIAAAKEALEPFRRIR